MQKRRDIRQSIRHKDPRQDRGGAEQCDLRQPRVPGCLQQRPEHSAANSEDYKQQVSSKGRHRQGWNQSGIFQQGKLSRLKDYLFEMIYMILFPFNAKT